jgi:phage repressor protein C with HTH and peptisase S24 domain
MGWATHHIAALQRGETAVFRPRGNSMTPRIKSGALCTVEPLTRDPAKGDVVLCKVGGAEYLHLVSAVQGDRFQISNNHGRVNGWVNRDRIYGLLTKVEP